MGGRLSAIRMSPMTSVVGNRTMDNCSSKRRGRAFLLKDAFGGLDPQRRRGASLPSSWSTCGNGSVVELDN